MMSKSNREYQKLTLYKQNGQKPQWMHNSVESSQLC